jgi:hypothetical protein
MVNDGVQGPMIAQLVTQMNRIEGKVDTMQVAFIQMAKTEERVVRLLESDQKKTEWLMKIQDRVVDLEKKEVGQNAVSSRIERAAWIIVTAVLTVFVGWLITHGGS